MLTSTPNFFEFDPSHIPFQADLLHDWDHNIDWSKGVHEFLLSGSVGSAKSLVAAHIIIRHALMFSGAKILIGRRTLPDLKDTLFQKIIEHLEGDERLVEGRDYWVNTSRAIVTIRNGSTILGKSWADKKYKKFRSLELSLAVIEEAVESEGDDYTAIEEIRQRLQRQPHIKTNAILYLTNPSSPRHKLYKHFVDKPSPLKHIYRSKTKDNKFLPPEYENNLRANMAPREAQRMLDGEWIEIDSERIYYEYKDANYIRKDYVVNPNLPVSISFDFNIGLGKPMSCVLSQYDVRSDTFHFFDEIVIHGSRTLDVLEELANRGYLDKGYAWEIHGDATGGARSTNSKYSNYEIIDQFLANYKPKTQHKLNYRLCIPTSNPPIKKRHNIVNAYCLNANKVSRLFVYEKCKVLDEGMRLTALKKGAEYIEDDSQEYQHVTTSLGYRVCYSIVNKVLVKGGNIG